jgi:hypothetical protein
MRLDVPYRTVGPISNQLIDNLVAMIEPEDWFVLDYRKKMFPTSSQNIYDSILLRHSKTYKTIDIENLILFDKFFPALEPILNELANYYTIVDYVAFMTRLGSGGHIAVHKDSGEFLETIHRVHIPLLTNSEAIYIVDNDSVCMERGIIYEIDNQRSHGVNNLGQSDRVHLIINIYDN